MTTPALHRLGDLQLQIMKVLWPRGEATVAEIHEVLCRDTRFAYTTIATMLRKMEARGLLEHRTEGRTFIYRSRIAEEQVERGMAEHVLERIFGGNLSNMVSHLLTSREVSKEELTRLERMISERKKKS